MNGQDTSRAECIIYYSMLLFELSGYPTFKLKKNYLEFFENSSYLFNILYGNVRIKKLFHLYCENYFLLISNSNLLRKCESRF